MPVAGPESGLQSVIGGRADGGELIHKTVLRKIGAITVGVGLIGITQTDQPGALAANITKLQGEAISQRLLEVEIPVLYVGRRQIARRIENVGTRRRIRRRG